MKTPAVLLLPPAIALLTAVTAFAAGPAPGGLALPRRDGAKPRNIVFVLTDDHRADAMSFLGHPIVETPHLDRLARGGAHLKNAMVTTSLCSPSRASILTGRYAHNHRVIDNYNPVPHDLIFFPQYLQAAGYETALVGKWHMGGNDDSPQRGFDHWVSFKGQGSYWPDNRGATRTVAQTSHEGFNVNGRRVPQQGYIADELTDHALAWLAARRSDRPFLLYLAHKAVHSDFVAADRHLGRYRDRVYPLPATAAPGTAAQDKPKWVRDQRNSRHGIEFGYNLPGYTVAAYARRYFETLLAVDESMGRIVAWLRQRGLLDSTLIVYLGDNGFHFGEHGLIDKRTAYEDSIKVPLLLHCPEAIQPGTVGPEVVANIDLAPTLLDFAGLVFLRPGGICPGAAAGATAAAAPPRDDSVARGPPFDEHRCGAHARWLGPDPSAAPRFLCAGIPRPRRRTALQRAPAADHGLSAVPPPPDRRHDRTAGDLRSEFREPVCTDPE
jgi:N-acetylglucosamine-6-sulfatase